MNLPNKLTVLRVCMIPLFLWALLSQAFPMPWRQLVAAFIFLLACTTDWLDGRIARKQGLVTTFGKFMDPLADKLLVCAALVALVELGKLPAWVVVILIGREFIVTGFRLLAAEKNIVIAAGFWGKVKTAVQMLMIVCVMIDNGFVYMHMINSGLILLSVVFSIFSAAEYIAVNRRVLEDLR